MLTPPLTPALALILIVSNPKDLILLLNELFGTYDKIAQKCGVHKVETIGDEYLAASGHDGNSDHAERIIKFCQSVIRAVDNVTHSSGQKLCARVGVSSGPATAGLVGLSMPRYSFFGPTVKAAQTIKMHGCPGFIAASSYTHSLLSLPSDFKSTWLRSPPLPLPGSSSPSPVYLLACTPLASQQTATKTVPLPKINTANTTDNNHTNPQLSLVAELNTAHAEIRRLKHQLTLPPSPISPSTSAFPAVSPLPRSLIPSPTLELEQQIAVEQAALVRDASLAATRLTRSAMSSLRVAKVRQRARIQSMGAISGKPWEIGGMRSPGLGQQ